jgi:glycosyltransferase involved in cell wall biosynthesis
LILQNEDDLKLLSFYRCINMDNTVIIRGAGIDTDAFAFSPLPTETTPIVIVCVARALWDKGIGELVAAAKIILKQWSVKIELYGALDPENPSAISCQQLQAWQAAGLITWHNHTPNIKQVYEQCHIAVLPSYREGLPKSLLEAASIGRPIVTTNTPGCRDVVEHGVNGFCVPVQDSQALGDALITLIENPKLRLDMGLAGRARVERYFKDTLIHEQTLKLYTN